MRLSRKRCLNIGERGQIVVLLSISLVVIVMCVGLSVDLGLAYWTKAKLQRAVDAGCMTGMKNLGAQGQSGATSSGSASFDANYHVTGIDANAPVRTFSFPSPVAGVTEVSVTATATINTLFMRVVPSFKTLNISASATASRGQLVMTMVLDRSGSMTTNGGSAALPPAAKTFVGYYDDTKDKVAMASFASNVTLDYAMNTPFKTAITNAINALSFTGATFGLGGLTTAKAQEDSVTGTSGSNLVKVVVYFTDGYVNTIQDYLSCNGTQKLYNFGGYDSGNYVGFFDPTTGNQIYAYDGAGTWYTCSNGNCNTKTNNSCLRNDAGFTSAIDHKIKTFTRSNVTADARYRSLQAATSIRAEQIYIYSIGLGNSVDQAFLQQIANDPASSSYDPNQVTGMAVFASQCPSQNCTIQLQQVFQVIAARVLLRLTD
jgi:hypothetical protein